MTLTLYRKKWKAWLFIFPAAVLFGLFILYPFFMNMFNSMFNIDSLGGKVGEWNNFENYKMMFKDPDMRRAICNTFSLMFYVIMFQGGIALLLAIITDSLGRKTKIYRTIYFFPMVVSATALGLMFNLLYIYPDGPLNAIISSIGMHTVIWKDEQHAFWAMLIPTIWQYVGFYFVLYLTGINNISEDVNEAAKLDGAVGVKRVQFITLPLIRPVLITALVLQITGSLKVFDLVWTLLPGGQPVGRTYLLGTYMYQMTFINKNVDYGASIAVFIVLVGALLSQIASSVYRKKD